LSEKIKFRNPTQNNFYPVLKQRIDQYFEENKINKRADYRMVFKTIMMLAMYFVPYFLILHNPTSIWLNLGYAVIMGIGIAGIGLSIMHDANHQSYSKHSIINNILGYTLNLIGGNAYTWKVQHNVLHHTYTNIHGHDEDLDAGIVVRFTEEAPHRKFHKFQHYYSVFLYGLLTFNWSLTTDFKQMNEYLKRNLSYGEAKNPKILWTTLVITKVIYFAVWIVIPMVLGISWWKVLIGFFIMHYTAGLILSIVFQLAHITNETTNPHPDENGEMESTWAIHQLFTTVNFAPKNFIVNWYTGGLNHQIEHHLFPNISHVHYGKIAKFVKETAQECNLPYYEYKTMRSAVIAHFKHLKELGMEPAI
jgi:linoleoyl-CoA desaturase